MSSFKPSISQTKTLKTFNVGSDQEDDLDAEPTFNVQPGERRALTPAEMAEFQRRKAQAMRGDEPMNSFSKKRLELLAGIGRLTRNVELDGITFTLRTLKARENKEAVTSVLGAAKTDLEVSLEFRQHTLARAIHMIDGQPVEMALGDDSLESRLELIDEMDETIVDRLNSEYQALVKDASGKYSFKTEEGTKEVIDGLKK